MKKIHYITLLLSVLFVYKPSAAQNESPDDKIFFSAMNDAIQEHLNKLKLDKLKSPFYIDYSITNAQMISVESSLGGIVSSFEKPYSNADANVLVGDYQQNNLNFYTENSMYGFYGGGFYIPMPQQANYDAVRRSLWIKTDNSYKAAAELIENKIGSLNQQNIPEEELKLADLSKVPVQTQILQNKITENLSKQQWESLAKELSSAFINYPYFTSSGVNIYSYHADVYYLNSEGMKYKQPFDLVCLRIYATTVADDGEPLMDYANLYFTDSRQIPAIDSLKNVTLRMASLLNQLRTAPVISETYSGPVLFEGEAVGEIVSQCFIENANGLLAGRKPFASNANMLAWNSEYFPSENNLEAMIGKKVVSRDLSINALDGTQEFNKIPLIGSYKLDAEGVSVKSSTSLITNGVLQTVLSDRIPTLKIQASNGHKRLALFDGRLSSSLCSGVIEMTSSKKTSMAKLKKQLLALAKEEDYEYAYIIKKIASPMANVPGVYKYTSTRKGQSITSPVYAYRISVKDGSETLVRMTKVTGMNLKAFKRVVAVSDNQQVYNTLQKGSKKSYYSYYSDFNLVGVPSSFIIPEGILFQELDIEKDKNIVLKKEPIAPNPLVSQGTK